jgi:hypothetical protein
MFIIELTLKSNPLGLSVQRKEVEDAEAVYRQVLDAMNAATPKTLELTCEREPEKKIAILSSEISAVQVAEKTSASMAGKSPGFWAQLSQ